MRKIVGHIIRIGGLVIEMLGIWGVYHGNGQKDQAQIQLPGGRAMPLAFIAVGLGFVLWLAGMMLIHTGRPRRRSPEQRELSP
jgi:hypothetical protein